MSIQFTIDATQLRAALAEMEVAERNGFHHCLAVFHLTSAGKSLAACQAAYSDLWERAHPTDGASDWGRFQGVTRTHRFVRGTLVPITVGATPRRGR